MPTHPAPAVLLQQLKKLFLPHKKLKISPQQLEVVLQDHSLALPLSALPLEIQLGKTDRKVFLVEDTPLCPPSPQPRGCLLVDPERYPDHISGFLRLEPHQAITLGRHSPLQEELFRFGAGVQKRHASLSHLGDAILVRDLDSGEGTRLTLAKKEKARQRMTQQRLENLRHLQPLLSPLQGEEGLALLRQVNAMSWSKSLRPRDDRGLPGGLLKLPTHLTPIVLGDLHTNLDNLLTVLSVNGFLAALQEGKGALIILGDSVHCELGSCLGEMDTSMVMMDTLFRLMLRFPQQVFYLLGNHDSFGADVFKGGVAQGQLWKNYLWAERGEAYVAEMEKFYRALPVMAVGKDFIACHAAPPNAPTEPEMIINIYKYGGLARTLVWNRLQRPYFPGGYVAGDVKRLRESFQLPASTPFIVAHTPLSREGTVWTDVFGIPHHHIVYSGRPHQVGLFTRVEDSLLPMVYFSDGARQMMEVSRAE